MNRHEWVDKSVKGSKSVWVHATGDGTYSAYLYVSICMHNTVFGHENKLCIYNSGQKMFLDSNYPTKWYQLQFCSINVPVSLYCFFM